MPHAAIGSRPAFVAALALLWSVLGAGTLVVASILFSPLIGLLVAIGVVAAGAIILAPSVGLLVTAFIIPIERIGRFGDDGLQNISLMRIIGIVALLSVVLHIMRRRLQPVLDMPAYLYGCLCVMAFVSYLYAHDPGATAGHAATMLGNFLFLLLIINGVRDWQWIKRLVVVWLAATTAVCIYQVYDWHFGVPIGDADFGRAEHRFDTTLNTLSEQESLGAARRAMGTTSNPAVYGINLLLALPFFLYMMRCGSSAMARLMWAGGTFLVLYNLLLTNTRAVVLFGGALLVLLVLTGLLRLTIPRLGFFAVSVAALVLVMPASVYERALNIGAYSLEHATNLRGRFDLWNAALALGSDHWATGIGVGNRTKIIEYLDTSYSDAPWITAHNEYLQVFVELGILGVALFLGFLASVLWRTAMALMRARRAGDYDRVWFLVAALLTIAIGMGFAIQVDAFHFPLKGWWLTAGLACVAYRLASEPRRSLPASGAA